MLKGFRNFLMQGELIVIAVGLVIALAFSTLILAFTSNIITPLVNAAGGGGAAGKGLGWTINGQRIDVGAFISAAGSGTFFFPFPNMTKHLHHSPWNSAVSVFAELPIYPQQAA